MNRKKQLWFQSIKRVINRCEETTDLLHYFQYVEIFERLLYNTFFKFFIKDNLISSNQSGFKQRDSCVYHLLSTTHGIYQSFDNGFEVRGVFLDISKWSNISARIPQGSILGPLPWTTTYSNTKLFADDTSLFSVMHYITQSGINLNDDLEKINNSAFQWKMSFNPDINKQAQEVSFFAKFISQIILL